MRFVIDANNALDYSLHIYKKIDKYPHFKKKWVKSTIVLNYLHCFYILIKNLVNYFSRNRDIISSDKQVLLYINSKNTLDVLGALQDESSVLFSQSNRFNDVSVKTPNTFNVKFKTSIWVNILSILNFPNFLRYWPGVLKYPNLYFENWGKFYSNMLFLKKNKHIKLVVFANDHNVQNRLFKFSCERSGIRTLYLQHASVTSNFPPLDFDYNFLFGQKDFSVYQKAGPVRGKVNLIGSPKFDKFYNTKDIFSHNIIGIATNLSTSHKDLIELIRRIGLTTSYKVSIKTHPNDSRKFSFKSPILIEKQCDSLINFLTNIDILFAADSSIHLEAIYSGVPTLYFTEDNHKTKDAYGFIEYNLVKPYPISEIDEEIISSTIADYEKQHENLKYFIESVNESIDGKVAEYVRRTIKSILE